MNINAINFKGSVFAGRMTDAMKNENRRFENSFRNMLKSPIFDAEVVDADELAFRLGVDDFQSDTMLRTIQNNMDNFEKEAMRSQVTKLKPVQITTAEQASNIEKFIKELEFLKIANNSDAFNIGGQISRLKQMLKRYYSSIGRLV